MADLPEKPWNREEQYLASIAGLGVDVPPCPWSRKEAYLDAINGRVESLQDELEELENNPDVADIVDTYADLEAYDTSTLTDKDIIRVLNDETHDGDSTYYRYSTATGQFTYIGTTKQYTNFVGTDGTTAGEAGLVPAPATTDAGKFLKADGTWGEAGGGVKILTSDDYNYHSSGDIDNVLALWLLDSGYYLIKSGTAVKVASSYSTYTPDYDTFAIVTRTGVYSIIIAKMFVDTSSQKLGATSMVVKRSNGSVLNASPGAATILTGMDVTSVYTDKTSNMECRPISAQQMAYIIGNGKSLGSLTTTTKTSLIDAINEVASRLINGGTTAPTSSTVGAVGTIYSYVDTSGGTNMPYLMVCTNVDTSGSTPVYTWSNLPGALSAVLSSVNSGQPSEAQIENSLNDINNNLGGSN